MGPAPFLPGPATSTWACFLLSALPEAGRALTNTRYKFQFLYYLDPGFPSDPFHSSVSGGCKGDKPGRGRHTWPGHLGFSLSVSGCWEVGPTPSGNHLTPILSFVTLTGFGK